MLQSLNDLLGFRLHTQDGAPVGVLIDLLFDEGSSVARYLLIESEDWLPAGELLVAPEALEPPDLEAQRLDARFSRSELSNAPRPEAPATPRREEEARLHEHFRWRPYWVNALASDLSSYWEGAASGSEGEADGPGEARLRSALEILGFEIEASDGHVGHIDDLIIDLVSWTVRYLVVDTGTWLPGKRVLISPEWLRGIDRARRRLVLELASERLETCPPYDRSAALDRRFEEMLHAHVGRRGYW